MILLSYPTEPDSSKTFYTGQRGVQTALIIFAVLCIPWMLLGKPVYRIVMNKRRANVSFYYYLLSFRIISLISINNL